MSKKIERALDRLNHILPLKENQIKCSEPIRKLHQQILQSFVQIGRSLNRAEISGLTANLDEAIKILKENKLVVFTDNDEPLGAYPFTMEKREHKVLINGHRVYAMCALDALSIAPMFNAATVISSICRVTRNPVHIKMSGDRITNLDSSEPVQVGIDWGAEDSKICCADSLCMQMIYLRDKKIAHQWLEERNEQREIFTLLEAVEFGERFFAPLVNKSELLQ